jgi:hypothetical protein
MNTNKSRVVMGFAVLAAMVMGGTSASAGTAYMAYSGAPYNNTPLSNYSVTDGTVFFANGLAWVVPIPIPTSSSVVTHTLAGNYGNMGAVQAWSFDTLGRAFSGVNFNSFNATISVPASGTVFVKGIATNTSLQAQMESFSFVN